MRTKKAAPSMLQRFKLDLRRNYILYVMIVPVILYYAVFAYAPMYGLQIAFREYYPKMGISNSPFVGWDNFARFFSSYNFVDLLKNTLGISVYSLLVAFPLPILFALMLNYLPFRRLKKTVQMISYAPHFISVVVLCGIINIFLYPDTGIFNVIREMFGLESVAFLSKPEWFKSIYVWSGVWQSLGWSSIIYISALSGVDMEQHEAAIIDGATKLQRIWNIDLPAISPTIVMLLILNIGQIMNVGYEKVFLLQTPLNMTASDVISTYVYRVGLINADYSYSTAVGLFNSVVNMVLVIGVNQLAKRIAKISLW